MYYNRKLKPPLLSTEMIIGIIVTVVFLVLIALSYFLAMGFGALITFSASMLTLMVYLRTRNPYFLPGIIGTLFGTAFLTIVALGMISFNSRYLDRSYVAFNLDGNVSVNISQQDYFLYHDRLAFDQLCHSMGKVFIGFMEQFQRGNTAIIIDQFNALKMNIITEG